MKYTPDFSSRFRILKGGKISLVVSALVAGSTMSFASPTGGQVTTGTATINQSGSVTTINQSTNKASINWNSFSIAPSETVNFVQPSSQSVTLNRVIGTSQSLIQGAMNANGQVFLLNPNGVLFTNGSQINVGGLVASTLNINDANFQAGNYVFEGNSQNSVLNMGTITASNGGYVAMMGKTVQNEGTIVATMGNVQLASGEKISLNLNGNSLVKLTIDQGTLNTLVENKGLIQADGGQVYLTTQALNTILDGMVNNTGIIEAQSIDDLKGEVILFAHGGTTTVSGTIDASGGFVETSGKNLSIADGTIVKAKTWLLDPDYVIIGDRIPNQYYADGLVETTIGASTIVSSLNAGTDVLIESDDDIEVNENIITGAMANDATLKLKAGGDITVYNNVTIDATQNSNTKKLNIWMSLANATGSRLAMNNSSSIKTNGGSFTVGGEIANGLPSINGTASLAYGVSISDGVTIDAGVGNITLTAAGSGGAVSVNGATLKGANIYLKAYGENDAELKGSNIEATQNLEIMGANVYMEGRDMEDADGNPMGHADTKLKADEISITSNALAENYPDTMEIYDTTITANSNVTINAASDVDLEGSQVNFENAGTLEINAYTSMTKQERIDAQILDWDAGDEATLLEWINDDEGTSYASMDEYFADNSIYLPMLVNLKGGTYNSKLFSDGTTNTVNTSILPILNNGLLTFGNGLQSSVNTFGMLNQPLYYDVTDERWYKLTYSNYSLAAIIGIGGDGADEWNTNGSFVTTITDSGSIPYIDGSFSSATLNTTGLTNGSGTIVATNTVTIDGKTLEMTNTYTLPSDKSLIAMDTKLENTSGSPMENVRLWVGAQDDWIGISDETTKQRGNLVDGAFEPIVDMTERAKALMITGSTSGVLFRTTSENSNVFSKENYGDDFYTQDPAESPVLITESDGAYGVFTRLTDLSNGQNESIRWYYGAGSIASLADLAEAVSELPNDSMPIIQPEPEIEEPIIVTPTVEQQVNNIITTIVNSTTVTPPTPIVVAPIAPQQQLQTQAENNTLLQSILPQGSTNGGSFGLVGSTDGSSPVQTVTMEQLQGAATAQGLGEIRVPLANNSLVELVNGGLNLPVGITQEFYVVDNSSNSGRARNMTQEDQDKKSKKN